MHPLRYSLTTEFTEQNTEATEIKNCLKKINTSEHSV